MGDVTQGGQDSNTAGQPGTAQLRELTFGEKAVGLNFNPGGDERVNEIKELYAKIIDRLNDLRNLTEAPSEQARLASVAITEAQGAQMWAVKAITWKD